MPRFKRTIPPFNATSSADIAFILLLFFLLSGSLSSNTGIYRHLFPNTNDQLKKKIDIEKRNFITFSIDGNNAVFMEDEPVKLHEIRDMAKTFIANPDNSDYLPEKQEIEIPELGLVTITPHAVINMEISRMSSYQTYISVLGELSAAYDELRNELANERFNKSFEHLSNERQSAIREAIPLRIAEKESERKENANEQIP
ncbi:MAG: biopolymer transporter ExbD [Dysgonamonadaceae bacterium]|jgi:biopolymer transport protein ExbD|nr:biopolymer transporter ExbD [Dysgonamonadaceae bacterium]